MYFQLSIVHTHCIIAFLKYRHSVNFSITAHKSDLAHQNLLVGWKSESVKILRGERQLLPRPWQSSRNIPAAASAESADLDLTAALTATQALAAGSAQDIVKVHLSTMLGLVLSDQSPLVEASPQWHLLSLLWLLLLLASYRQPAK
jgi:hypothetical protein